MRAATQVEGSSGSQNLIELLVQRAQQTTTPAVMHKQGGRWEDVSWTAVLEVSAGRVSVVVMSLPPSCA